MSDLPDLQHILFCYTHNKKGVELTLHIHGVKATSRCGSPYSRLAGPNAYSNETALLQHLAICHLDPG